MMPSDPQQFGRQTYLFLSSHRSDNGLEWCRSLSGTTCCPRFGQPVPQTPTHQTWEHGSLVDNGTHTDDRFCHESGVLDSKRDDIQSPVQWYLITTIIPDAPNLFMISFLISLSDDSHVFMALNLSSMLFFLRVEQFYEPDREGSRF